MYGRWGEGGAYLKSGTLIVLNRVEKYGGNSNISEIKGIRIFLQLSNPPSSKSLSIMLQHSNLEWPKCSLIYDGLMHL